MNLTLTIQEEDYGFVVEAIKLRTTSMLESFDNQVHQQRRDAMTPTQKDQQRQEIKEALDAQFTKELAKLNERAKPKAARTTRKAPYGFKKDGTPKKKPGPPVGF